MYFSIGLMPFILNSVGKKKCCKKTLGAGRNKTDVDWGEDICCLVRKVNRRLLKINTDQLFSAEK